MLSQADFKSEHKENAPGNQFELNMKDSKFEFNIPSRKAGKVEWIEELNDAERFREKTVSGIDKEIVELRQINKIRKIPDGPRLITVNEYNVFRWPIQLANNNGSAVKFRDAVNRAFSFSLV